LNMISRTVPTDDCGQYVQDHLAEVKTDLKDHIRLWRRAIESKTVDKERLRAIVHDFYRLTNRVPPNTVVCVSHPLEAQALAGLLDGKDAGSDARTPFDMLRLESERMLYEAFVEPFIPDFALSHESVCNISASALGTITDCVKTLAAMGGMRHNPLDIARRALRIVCRDLNPEYFPRVFCSVNRHAAQPGLEEIGCYNLIAASKNPAAAVTNLRIVDILMQFLEFGGWAILSKPEIAYVVLKPRTVKADETGIPHCDNGPALELHDGTRYFFHHGVAVPEEAILRIHDLIAQKILAHPNAEVRRVMIARKGLSAILKESDPELLDADYERNNPNPRKLYRLRVPRDEPIVALHVVDPAKKRLGLPADVFLRVPPTMETCAQAVAWTFGFDNNEDYRPVREE